MMSSVEPWALGPYLTVEPEGGGGSVRPHFFGKVRKREAWERRREIEAAIARALEATENVLRRRDADAERSGGGDPHRPVRGRPVPSQRQGPGVTRR